MSGGHAPDGLSALVRRFRLSAGLSQEALAERAGMSARGVSDLERGLRRVPHPATLARLAEALDLAPEDRALLFGARPHLASKTINEPRPPRELSSFVGRQREVAEVVALMDQAPLVTLAGPGGAGKTRLALRVTNALEPHHVPVVVELAPTSDPELLPRAVGAAIGLPDPDDQPLHAAINVLRQPGALLVMDNCEHLIAACAELVDTLLRACPDLRILATSREPLGVEGEVVFRVPPLGLPTEPSLDACARSEAVQLFVERARSARGDIALDAESAPVLAQLCGRLDGLPLAIELAAARAASLSLKDISARLAASGHVLSGGHRLAPARQRTMHAAIVWSYELLSEHERRLFESLSVFVSSFELEQAEAMHSGGGDTLDVLDRLVRTSMVQLESLADGSARYRLLQPLRDFGRERLAQQGELDAHRARHARSMLAMLQRAGHELEAGPRQLAWFRRMDLEWDNLRAALDWAEAAENAEIALGICAPLWVYWSRPNRRTEGRVRLRKALAIPGAEEYPLLRARVAGTLAFLAARQADLPAATALLEDALQGARLGADLWLTAGMLRADGYVRLFIGELDQAEDRLHQTLELARSAGVASIEAQARVDMAGVAIARGDLVAAETQLRDAARLAALHEEVWAEALALNSLGDLLRARGEVDGAEAAYRRALPSLQAMNGDHPPEGMLHNLAYIALARGEPSTAVSLLLDSTDRYRAIGGDWRGLAECAVGLAAAAIRLRQPDLAARLFGAADATLERLGTGISPVNRADYDRVRAELALALGPEERERMEQAGRGMRLEQALDEARVLASLEVVATARPHGDLTPRELEVAELLSRGLRNRDIAEALVITEKTAANHVQRVLDKLGVDSRAQVAARAAEFGITRS